jgi:hypothetical protein
MRDVEHELETMATARPRKEFDARMAKLFAETPPRRKFFWSAKVPMWQTIAACALSVAFGFLLNAYISERPAPEPAVTKTIYFIPTDDSLRRVFDRSESGVQNGIVQSVARQNGVMQ